MFGVICASISRPNKLPLRAAAASSILDGAESAFAAPSLLYDCSEQLLGTRQKATEPDTPAHIPRSRAERNRRFGHNTTQVFRKPSAAVQRALS